MKIKVKKESKIATVYVSASLPLSCSSVCKHQVDGLSRCELFKEIRILGLISESNGNIRNARKVMFRCLPCILKVGSIDKKTEEDEVSFTIEVDDSYDIDAKTCCLPSEQFCNPVCDHYSQLPSNNLSKPTSARCDVFGDLRVIHLFNMTMVCRHDDCFKGELML
jgi:hypothetical protein